MPVSCSALDCKNRFMKGSGITFHRFPISRPDLMAKWLKAVARENWMPSPKATLCSDHFTKDCFEERNDRRHLQFSSVPTIFPPPKNKTTGSRRPHKAKACGHQKVTSEIQLLLLPWQAGSVDEALSQPTESIKITDVQSTLTAETLNTGRLAELAAAAAVLNLAEFSQVLAVPLKAEAESSEVLTVLNCSAETQTCATDAQIESVSSGLITAHSEEQSQDSEEQSQNSEEQSQDSAVALCSDALHCTANVLELCSDSFHWTANVLPRPEVLSDAATALMGSMDVSAMAASVLPCLFTTSADRTSDRATISEGTTWISTEVLIPETETHLSTPVLASEELQCSSEMVLSYYDDQDLSRMPFRQDHSYFMNPCPDTIRKTLEKKLAWERKKNADHRQKFRVLQQKLKRKEQKIYSLCKIIKLLRERKTDDLCNSNI